MLIIDFIMIKETCHVRLTVDDERSIAIFYFIMIKKLVMLNLLLMMNVV